MPWNSNVILDNFIFSVPFDFTELNKKHKPRMIDRFNAHLENDAERKLGNNCPYEDEEYSTAVLERFYTIIHKEFDLEKEDGGRDSMRTPHIYCQTHDIFASNWHNHKRTSVINGVFYIDPPKEGGELEFECEGINTLKVEANTLYVFPAWLVHRPMPQKDKHWRICVNLEYVCDKIPFYKAANVRW